MSTTPKIKVGDPLPAATFRHMTPEGVKPVTAAELFGKGKSVLFAVPGAFTPTCSNIHLPGFVTHASEFKKEGVQTLACISVNDAFVMDAWGKAHGAQGKVAMLADGNGEFTAALGLTLDGSAHGLGTRSQRYAMVVRDGKVESIYVEDKAGMCDGSGAPSILKAL